jgi:hypothetical protein
MRINIIGAGAGWELSKGAPGSNWGVNDLCVARPVDVVVDVHHLQDFLDGRAKPGRREISIVVQELAVINLHKIPLYTVKRLKDVPTSMKYPLVEIKKEFGSDYFGSGVDYAIALAIYKGATEIHTYGVNVLLHDEYAHQKPSTEHWLGVAKGKSIKVEVHGESELLKTHDRMLYGYNIPQERKSE